MAIIVMPFTARGVGANHNYSYVGITAFALSFFSWRIMAVRYPRIQIFAWLATFRNRQVNPFRLPCSESSFSDCVVCGV